MNALDIIAMARSGKGGGDVTKAYVDEQISDVRDDVTIPASSSSSPITDSADGYVQDLTVYGESRTSKNLLDVQTVTVDNITFTVDSDKYITANPANSDSRIWTYANSQYFLTLPAGTYNIVFIAKTQTLNRNAWLKVVNAENQELAGVDIINKSLAAGTFTLSATTDIGVMCKLWDAVARFMICTAADYETDPTFEPYFSGIHGIGEDGELKITTCGKNLFDKTEITDNALLNWDGVSKYTTEIPSDGYYVTDYIPVYAGKTIHIPASGTARRFLYNLDKTIRGYLNNSSDQNLTVSNDGYIRVSYYKEVVSADNLQIELGSIATAYEPYVSTTATVTTGIPLYSVGDVKDELDEKKGVVVKRCMKVVLDGSEYWWLNPDLPVVNNSKPIMALYLPIRPASSISQYEADGICDKLAYNSQYNISSGDEYGISIVGTRADIRINGITTVEDLKTYLASNPVTAVYELAEPYELPLTASEIAQLRNLRTYSGATNITITDDPEFTADYFKNSENGQAVADLQTELQKQISYFINKIGLKSISWTGTGTASHSITFPEKPFMVIGFTQDPIEDRYTRGIIPFIFERSSSQLCMCWTDTNVPTGTYTYYSNMRVNINENTMSWTAEDASQALNMENVTYTLYYI